jgi:hypothetical protein
METARVCGMATAMALLWSCAGTPLVVQVQPEEPAVLHVGALAAVQVPSDRHYEIGSAGRSLVLLKQTEKQGTMTYLYRAVAVGNQTLVATPREPGLDGCVSCVTVHHFIKVVD